MANPLGVLGQIAGGLSTTGAQGAAGGFQGMVEGEDLRRKHQSEEQLNALRALQAIRTGQQVQQGQTPFEKIEHGIKYRVDPMTGTMTKIGPAELGPLDQSLEAERRATTAWREKQTAAGPKGPTLTEVEASIMKSFADDFLAAKARGDVYGQQKALLLGNQALSAFRAKDSGAADRPLRGRPGDVFIDPTGKPIYTVPGTPAGQVPRETLTTTMKIVPRRQITNIDDINRLNDVIPEIVTELSAKPGFDVPGAYVKLPNGMNVRKEDIIAQAIMKRLGVEVTVRWDGKRFRLVKAWEPATREPMETRRTTGPPSQGGRSDEDEED